MNTSNELFELIGSMTANEKRYFKLFASAQKGDKLYLKLFDLIDKNGITTNGELLRRADLPVKKNKIAFTKNYLYKLINRNLIRAKDDSSDLDTRLRNIYTWCKILYDKALFGQYFRFVRTGKELSKTHERFGMLVEFLEIERTLSKKEELTANRDEKYFEEEKDALKKIGSINKVRYIVTKLLRMQRESGVVRTPEQMTILNEIESELIALSKLKAGSITFEERHSFAMQILSMLKNERKNAHRFAEKRIAIIDDALHVFENSLQDIVRLSKSELIGTAIDTGKIREARSLLKDFTGRNRMFAIDEINRRIFEILIAIAESKSMSDKQVIEFVCSVLGDLSRLSGKLTALTQNIILFRLSVLCAGRGFGEKSIEVLNQLLLKTNVRHTPFLESYARILFAAVHLELGNIKLVRFLIPSTMKLLKERNTLHRTERTMLQYLKKYSAANSLQIKISVTEEFANKMRTVMSDNLEKNSTAYFYYAEYLEKRLRQLTKQSEEL